jgi:AcrR family transcriptional regulator
MSARKKDAELLSRERIVEAAMRVIDAEGLDALSMRRLGVELRVNPMAAYHYVPNKASLYDLVVDAVMSGVDLAAVDPDALVQEQIKQVARAYRAAILAHPHAIPVFASRTVRSAAAVRPFEPLVGVLFEAGLAPTETLAAIDTIALFILGGAVGQYSTSLRSEKGEQRDFDPLPPEEFPNLSRLLAEGSFLGFDQEFEFGLDVVVRGLLGDLHPEP